VNNFRVNICRQQLHDFFFRVRIDPVIRSGNELMTATFTLASIFLTTGFGGSIFLQINPAAFRTFDIIDSFIIHSASILKFSVKKEFLWSRFLRFCHPYKFCSSGRTRRTARDWRLRGTTVILVEVLLTGGCGGGKKEAPSIKLPANKQGREGAGRLSCTYNFVICFPLWGYFLFQTVK